MNTEIALKPYPKPLTIHAESMDKGGVDQVEIVNDVRTNHSTRKIVYVVKR